MDKRLVLLACFLTVFVSYSVRYGYGILLPEMLTSLAISKTEAGIIFTSFFIAYTISSPILGLLGDRYNPRVLLTVFVALLGTGTFLMALSSSVTISSLFFALAGMGSAACWAPVMALAQRWTSEKHRGTTLAFVDTGSALGIVVTSTAIPLIVVNNWRTGWMTLGVMAFAAAILNFFVIRSYPKKTLLSLSSNPEKSTGGSVGEIYKKILGDFRFWLIGLAYLLTGFSILVQFTFLSTYAVQELGYPYVSAARLMLVIGIGAIVGKLTLGPLSDKVGRIRVMILCAALITMGNLGTAFGQGISLMISTAVFSLGYGTAWAMYAASATDYFTRENPGSVVGLWTVYLGIGSVLSPVVAGWIADITGTLTWSFVMAAAGGGLSLLLLLPLWNMSSNAPSRK